MIWNLYQNIPKLLLTTENRAVFSSKLPKSKNNSNFESFNQYYEKLDLQDKFDLHTKKVTLEIVSVFHLSDGATTFGPEIWKWEVLKIKECPGELNKFLPQIFAWRAMFLVKKDFVK